MSLDKVSARVKELSTAIRGGMAFDDEGFANTADEVITNNLPEGVGIDTVKKVQNFLLEVGDAATLALGEEGVPFLKDHPDLKSVSMKVRVGHNTINAEMMRSKETTKPFNREAGPTTKYGTVQTKMTTGVGSSKGNYKQIQAHLSELATSVFSQ